MTDSLNGARLKLIRARKHLEVLGDELAAFNAIEPYRIVHEPNADGSEHTFRAEVVKEPPAFLSVLIGDALQNMRSALEHLAWGLTPQATRDTAERTIGFPICRTEQSFFQTNQNSPSRYDPRTGGMHKIWTMDPKVRAAIQQLQPYYTGHDDLLILNELARVDRHQSLRFMGGFGNPITESWREKESGPFANDFSLFAVGETHWIRLGPFEDGAEIGYFRFREPEMEVKLQVSRYVAFRDAPAKGRHVLGTLTSIRKHIERVVVPKLERFF